MKVIELIGNDTATIKGYGIHDMAPGDVIFYPSLNRPDKVRLRSVMTYYRKRYKKDIHSRTRVINGVKGVLVYCNGSLSDKFVSKRYNRRKRHG